MGKYIFDRRISQAAWVTLWLTIYSMIGAIVIGLLLAIMRLSPNPVLKSIAWLYIWIFRGTPVYVQLVFWGIVSLIYPVFTLGIPFMEPWVTIPNEVFTNLFITAVIGLALNEAAYMSEIVRAGLLSVDEGQEEASTALAMSWGQTMRYVVVPQAMKIIIPPTGNEVISMLKTTSLVAAIPLSIDLYGVSRGISAVTFTPVPLLIVASLWYLLFTSVLMVGQHFIEKRFSRGTGRVKTGKEPATPGPAPTAVPGEPDPRRSAQTLEEKDDGRADGACGAGLQEFRHQQGAARDQPRGRPRRGALHRGPQRFGQVDVPALHQPPGTG